MQDTKNFNNLAFYESIINSSDDAIYSIDFEGTIITWNKGAEELFNYTADTVIGQKIIFLLPKELINEEEIILSKIKAGEHIRHYETKRLRKNGTLVYISLTVSAVKNKNGDIIGASKIARDITETKIAEELLVKVESNYKRLVDNILDGLMIDDKDGKVIYANNQFLKLFGLNSDDLNHINLEDYIAPEHRKFLRERHDKRIAGEEVPDTFEYLGIKKDGEKRWMEVRVSKIYEDGQITGTQSVIRDITDQKVANEKIITSEKIYKTIAANLPDAIVTIINKERKYVLIEGEGLINLGLDKNRLLNKTKFEGLTLATEMEVEVLRNRAFNGETLTDIVKAKDLYYKVRYLPIKEEDGSINSVMTISLDITDIKRAEIGIKEHNESLEKKVKERTLKLEAANNELESFSYSVSHDLRAPLRIINGYADILQQDYKEKLDDEGKRFLESIRNNTARMGILIDELLNLANLGRKEILMQQANMNIIVNSEIQLQKTITKNNFNICVNDLVDITCDVVLIRQVWSNLISNAIKYSAKNENAFIEIGCKENTDSIIYIIKDNGVGFDMKYKDKLFAVFQRLHKKSEFEGTGVGLALVQRIINKHGGDVWAESEVNKGATFYFSLKKNLIINC